MSKTADEMLADYYERRLAMQTQNAEMAWRTLHNYEKAVKAQQVGMQRQARKIYRLRKLLQQHGINPENGPPRHAEEKNKNHESLGSLRVQRSSERGVQSERA